MASDPNAMKRLDDVTAEMAMEIVAMNMRFEDMRDELVRFRVEALRGLGTVRRMAGLDELAEPRIRRTVAS